MILDIILYKTSNSNTRLQLHTIHCPPSWIIGYVFLVGFHVVMLSDIHCQTTKKINMYLLCLVFSELFCCVFNCKDKID